MPTYDLRLQVDFLLQDFSKLWAVPPKKIPLRLASWTSGGPDAGPGDGGRVGAPGVTGSYIILLYTGLLFKDFN